MGAARSPNWLRICLRLVVLVLVQLQSMGTSIEELRAVLRGSGYVPGRMPTEDDGEWVPAGGR
jgi:hypothetical protein